MILNWVSKAKMNNRPFQILSIQSHVVYGYVGNKVTTFALQRLGNEVMTLNTLQFSNHTGYNKFSGQIFDKNHISELFAALSENKFTNQLDAVLSGYIGSSEIAQACISFVMKLKKHNENLLYCLDPVMGDEGQLYVSKDIAEFFKDKALAIADIITPNQFEATYLTGIKINSVEDLKRAAFKIYSAGPKIVFVKSILQDDMSNKRVVNLVFNGLSYYMCATPYIYYAKTVSGNGDLISALFLAHYLKHKDVVKALELSTSTAFSIFNSTIQKTSNELALITNQEMLVTPTQYFSAEKI